MTMNISTLEIEKLYNLLLASGTLELRLGSKFIVYCSGISIRTVDNIFTPITFLSKHKSKKDLIKFYIKPANTSTIKTIVLTSDHSCMLYRDNFFENVKAKFAKLNDQVSIYDEATDAEVIGYICQIENLGKRDEYVYDAEVEDNHQLYANDILVHNSQFVSIKCISDWMIATYNLPKNIRDWTQEKRQELWDIVEKMVTTEINPFARKYVHDYCKTNNQNVLAYSLEYMCDIGIYEQKKHYACHKIFDEGDAVDKIKYSGIELKKATIAPLVKNILKYVYEHVLTDTNWTELAYKNYIIKAYEDFCKLSIDQISLWKGYSSERSSTAFLTMEKGSTAIASAATFWNQLVKKHKLSSSCDEIRVGQKVRFCYVQPNNVYGIKYIAFPDGQWPKDFNDKFLVDYEVMFEKCIIKPLTSYMIACKFSKVDPTNQMLFDVEDL